MYRHDPLFPCICVMLCIAGCVEYDEATALPRSHFERFVIEIQPTLGSRCANPSCHGSSSSVLEIYETHFHRLDPAGNYLDSPLSDDELHSNYYSALGFVVDLSEPERSLLLLKPLAENEGGIDHDGGVQFSEPESWQYATLLAWIADALAAGRSLGENTREGESF